ncbi:MAG TPA: DUF448 domain-containing protein [Sulfuricurvum sp.]|nr:DUF448 domain-containing protein [Sulfuricurvum sp.]
MAQNVNQPIRMCVVCRERFVQSSLIRLQCREGKLESYQGLGRSFYLCSNCIEHKKTPGLLARHCKSNALEMLMNRLKEIVVNDG